MSGGGGIVHKMSVRVKSVRVKARGGGGSSKREWRKSAAKTRSLPPSWQASNYCAPDWVVFIVPENPSFTEGFKRRVLMRGKEGRTKGRR